MIGSTDPTRTQPTGTEPTQTEPTQTEPTDLLPLTDLAHTVDPTMCTPTMLARATMAQWQLVAAGVTHISNWALATRVGTWDLRLLVAHLVVVAEAIAPTVRQPPSSEEPVTVYNVMGGAPARAPGNDARARQVADDAPVSVLLARLQDAVDETAVVLAPLARADNQVPHGVDPPRSPVAAGASTTVDGVLPTRFGPLPLRDFLVHRIVEGVVHGLDLPDPVSPDPEALAVAAAALAFLAHLSAPQMSLRMPEDAVSWIEMATGRRQPAPDLASFLPVLR